MNTSVDWRGAIVTTHLAVVDDDPAIRSILAGLLTSSGFIVHEARNGEELRRVLAQTPIRLVLLDIGLGPEDGLEIAKELRSKHDVAVIMVTARSDEIDRVVGLELGADDYIVKPFKLREVVARVRAVLRRCSVAVAVNGKSIHFGDWVIDLDAKLLKHATGKVISLTHAEYELLEVLARRPGRLLTREMLLDLTQRTDADVCDRSIDTLVGRLRKKMDAYSDGAACIRTVRGSGYMLTR